MDPVSLYKQAVEKSTLLNFFEKSAMLEGVESFPPDFLTQMTQVLSGFDSRSTERRQAYLAEIQKALTEYRSTINGIAGLSPEKKKMYLAKADTLVKAITSHIAK